MKIELLYFREGGKYYSSGEYVTEHTTHHDIVAEVKAMRVGGALPGLQATAALFYHVLIQFPKDSPLDVPHFIPLRMAR